MIHKSIVRIKIAAQKILARMRKSAEVSAHAQEQINTARAEMLQKYPETFNRRWPL